jgi:hypothetical protein
VPWPYGFCSVSDWRTVTVAGSTPSVSAAIWPKVVWWLCPVEADPIVTMTSPLGCTRMFALSQVPPSMPSCDMRVDGPTPQTAT